MKKTAPDFTKSEKATVAKSEANSALCVADLERHARDWIFDGEYRQHSSRTLESRRFLMEKLAWFLSERGYTKCDTAELRQFLAYVANGHKEPGGRWGNPGMTRPVRAITIRDYYTLLRAFCNWLVREGVLGFSPVDRLDPPIVRVDHVQPFEPDQQQALLQASRRTLHPRRDEAIIMLLLDTGLRASELCGLKLCDLDLDNRSLTVVGKGSKRRTVYFSRPVAKALWHYLREHPRGNNEPVFLSDRGARAGEPLTRSGLLQFIRRLGRKARIHATRCSPHTFRHTFAVEFLRAGGNVFSLQQMLGHTGLSQTQRYVALAQADIQNQHQQFSPIERLRKHTG